MSRFRLPKLRWPVISRRPRRAPVSAEALAARRLVMTLLVRDEEELLEWNLEHHFAMGVDFVVVTDNGSTDSTPEILARYEREGRVRTILEPEQTYRQSEWVNRMGRIAYEELGADIVFHCDADEFWQAESGNLKSEVIARPEVDVLQVPVRNVLLRARGGKERFPEDAIYAVEGPFSSDDWETDSREMNMFLFRYPPSVIFSTARGVPAVRTGNHGLEDSAEARVAPADSMRIDHYPVQGHDAFARKALGGKALVEHHADRPNAGWHWRRWYAALEEGRLDEEYRRLILSEEEAAPLLKAGRLVEVPPITKSLRRVERP